MIRASPERWADHEISVLGKMGIEDLSKKHTEGSLILFCRGAARTNAGAAAIIPGHSGDQHRHAAGIRNACKNEARPHEARQGDPGRIDEVAEQRAGENQRPRGNAHLALQRHHFAATIKRQSLCLPRLHATIEDAKRGESACLEFLRSLARAIAAAANQNALKSFRLGAGHLFRLVAAKRYRPDRRRLSVPKGCTEEIRPCLIPRTVRVGLHHATAAAVP